MAQPKVFLGIGHGGSDPGAVANGFEEEDLNLAIGIACSDELVRHGVAVMMSRTKDEDDPMAEVIAECNAFNPDLAADIHNNAGGGDGAEVYHHHGGGNSKKMAQNILNSIAAIGQNSRGIKTKLRADGRDYYAFIRDTKPPAVIVECAFVDNKKDLQIIDTAAEQKAMGIAIAKGLLQTLGISYKAPAAASNDYSKHWAAPAIQSMIDKKIMVGNGAGRFRPNDCITRGEIAQAFDNLLNYLNK